MNKAAYAGALAAGALLGYLCMPASVSAQGGRARTSKMEIPVQKSGKVVMADGSPLPEPVDVEASCGGSVGLPIAKTDSKGGFVVGSGRTGQADARMQGDSSSARGVAAGCALQARLPGYESSTLRVIDAQAFDLGTIVLSRRSGVEGSTFSGTALKAPKDAKKNFEKAQEAIKKNKLDQARPLLEKAVAEYPEYAMAWFELGKIYQAAKDLPAAQNAYQQAIKADAKYIYPYLHLAAVFNAQQNWKGTAEMTAQVIKLDPFDYPAAYSFNAMSHIRMGNAAEAEASAKKVVEMGASAAFPEAEYMLGVILANRGETKAAMEHLTNYLKLAPNAPGAEQVRKQLAEMGAAAAAAK